MAKLALAKSVSKQYLSLQKTMRRNKKLVSSWKLIVVLVIFFSVLAIYAANITESSTKGYFHRQESKINDELCWTTSLEKGVVHGITLKELLTDYILSLEGYFFWLLYFSRVMKYSWKDIYETHEECKINHVHQDYSLSFLLCVQVLEYSRISDSWLCDHRSI